VHDHIAVVSSQLPPTDLVCPLFFLNSATLFLFYSGVTLLDGITHPGQSAPRDAIKQLLHPTLKSATSVGCAPWHISIFAPSRNKSWRRHWLHSLQDRDIIPGWSSVKVYDKASEPISLKAIRMRAYLEIAESVSCKVAKLCVISSCDTK